MCSTRPDEIALEPCDWNASGPEVEEAARLIVNVSAWRPQWCPRHAHRSGVTPVTVQPAVRDARLTIAAEACREVASGGCGAFAPPHIKGQEMLVILSPRQPNHHDALIA